MMKKRYSWLALVIVMLLTTILPTGSSVYAASDPSTHTFDISEGDITVSAGSSAGTLKVTYAVTTTLPAGIVVDNVYASQNITIQGTTTKNKVVVNGVNANIILNNVDIQLEPSNNNNAFALTNASNVTLTLTGSNTLKATANGYSALNVNTGQTLTIMGSGSLLATSFANASGIGRCYQDNGNKYNGGTINIQSGTVSAIGGSSGAGIGGTNGGPGGTINISGGIVTALGGDCGAGIGGGIGTGGGTINISGGTVTATGTSSGAGIGGGRSGAGGNITISEGTVTATGGLNAAGIGGGADFGVPGAAGVITISSNATVRAASSATDHPAIYAVGNALTAESTARVLMANFNASKAANTNTSVYVKSSSLLNNSFAPDISYNSIAFTVPADTYQLKTNDILQQQGSAPPSTDFAVSGFAIFNNVADHSDPATVSIVKSLVEGASYTMTQAEATSEAAVKTAIETKIASLALDGVTPTVTKVLYTEAAAGNAATPAGTNGTYTFTVGLLKGAASATTATLTMTVTATPYDPDPATVSTVKGLVEGASYTMTQAEATSEAAIKTAIETKIASLALDGVTPTVTKVLYTEAAAGNAATPAGTNGTYTFTVGLLKGTASATTETLTMTVTATPYVTPPGGNGGGGSDNSPNNISNNTGTDILVNSKAVNAGTAVNKEENGKTITTVTIDKKKLATKLETEGNNATVTILVKTDADTAIGELDGQMVRNMETKEATLEIMTNSVKYVVPASEINIGKVSEQFGQEVALSDIKVHLQISEPSTNVIKLVESAAKTGEFSIVVPAVDFSINCTYNGKTVDINNFNAYLERTVAIPDGNDPTKITTGLVVNADGTTRHVPTKIIIIQSKYYAVINSLTNSTYVLVWHPIEFADVTRHWAKDAINDMGAKMVISGVGDNNYDPDKDITRAEFAAIIIRALGLEPETGENSFDDVAKSEWYYGYIGAAASYGIISGYNSTTFGPNDKITREQAMVLIARAMKITGLDANLTDSEMNTLLASYSDTADASSYAKTSIAICLKTGVMTGRSSSTVVPKDYITRAEVAAIVQRLLEKSDLI